MKPKTYNLISALSLKFLLKLVSNYDLQILSHLGGWGWGKIENKNHHSPTETEIRVVLGNNPLILQAK